MEQATDQTKPTESQEGVPFASRSVSLGVHPASELSASEVVDDLMSQARVAEAAGFAGVTLSEHHNGLAGYLPQPLLVSGWILEETSRVWAGPAPTLLTLRNAHLLAEEIAWMSVRYPGRFAAAVASGYNPHDFGALGLEADDIPAKFVAGLTALKEALTLDGTLSHDQAVRSWNASPAPLLSAAHSPAAARRAADLSCGVLLIGSPDVADRPRRVVDAYKGQGGNGPVAWIRRCFIGQPPPAALRELEAAYGSWNSGSQGTVNDVVFGSSEEVAETLRNELGALSGDACLNVRVYLPGVSPAGTQEQIEQFGAEVLPILHGEARSVAV